MTWFKRWFLKYREAAQCKRSQRPRNRLELEPLEYRITPSTSLVQDIFPGPFGSTPKALTNVNGTVFFAAADGTHGKELWKSDGTSAGTVLVKDIRPGSYSSLPS